jgi:class 3 adenylate cyclase
MVKRKSSLETSLIIEREREALLANLRSEFSIPIDVIIGYAQILLHEVEKHQIKDYVDDLNKILKAGSILQINVDQLLDLEYLAEKEKEFDFKKFSSDLQFSLLTPLTSIMGYCEIILEDEDALKNKQFILDINKIYEAATLFIHYVTEIDNLASSRLAGIDLLAQFKNSSLIVRKVITSIPPLEEDFIYHPSIYKGSILVIDDNKMASDLLMRRIMHYGFSATPCYDPLELLDKMDLANYDLILLEIVMSHVSGFDVLRKIKKNRRFSHIPIIVTSPLKEIDTFVRCLELGADDYLKKPINAIIFEARISASVERKILRDNEKKFITKLTKEKAKSENLLLNIVPASIAKRLKRGRSNIVDKYPMVTVIFIDIVGFTELTEKISPEVLIKMLNLVFSTIDHLTDKYQLEKIKTIGDSYMAVCGAPIPNVLHAELVAEFALDVLEAMEALNKKLKSSLKIRLGVHTGPVIAGVIGKKKFMYDLWGATVNTASRLESTGVPNQIQLSESTYEILKDKYLFKKRGTITAKGIGQLNTYFLIGRSEKLIGKPK